MERNIKVIKIIPQGYCKGVVCAIKTINNLLKEDTHKKPYYMLGKLVHNTHVTDAYQNLGIKIIDEYSNISRGTIIVTAHGLSQKQKQDIQNKGLDLVDTTCQEVLRIETNVQEKIDDGYTVLYYGKLNHPECKSIMSINSKIHLLTCIEDINQLDILDDKIYFTNQTTMSYLDLIEIVNTLKMKYHNITFDIDICNASKSRQLALLNCLDKCNLIVVVGDKLSNNTMKLKELCEKNNKDVVLVENIDDVSNIKFIPNMTIGVTAGASTPNKLVDEVINKIKDSHYISKFTNNDYISF